MNLRCELERAEPSQRASRSPVLRSVFPSVSFLRQPWGANPFPRRLTASVEEQHTSTVKTTNQGAV